MWSMLARYDCRSTNRSGPLALGRAGRIHPVLVIFCFLAGGLLFGVAGVIMAVPVALAIRAILATLYGEPQYTRR